MARNDPQVNMRMSEQLKSKLDEAAIANNRSLTAEITARLERSFVDGPDFAMVLADAQYEAAVQAVERESLRVQFTSLASLVEVVAARAREALTESLNAEELELLNAAIKDAEEERAKQTKFEEAIARVAAARRRVEESRYRFLEAKGAKGVRDAKV